MLTPCPKYIQEKIKELKKELLLLEEQVQAVKRDRNKNVVPSIALAPHLKSNGKTKPPPITANKKSHLQQSKPSVEKSNTHQSKPSIEKPKVEGRKNKNKNTGEAQKENCCCCSCDSIPIDSKANSCVGTVFTKICGPDHVHHTIKIPCSAVASKTWGDIFNEGKNSVESKRKPQQSQTMTRQFADRGSGTTNIRRFSKDIETQATLKKSSKNKETQHLRDSRSQATQMDPARTSVDQNVQVNERRPSKSQATQMGHERRSVDEGVQVKEKRRSRDQETQIRRDSRSCETQANVYTADRATATKPSSVVAETVSLMQREIRDAKDEKDAAFRDATRKALIIDKLKVLLEANAAIVKHQARSVSMVQRQIEDRLDAERKDATAVVVESTMDEIINLTEKCESAPKIIEEALQDLSRMAKECFEERLKFNRTSLRKNSASSGPLQHSSPNASRLSCSESVTSWEEISAIVEE